VRRRWVGALAAALVAAVGLTLALRGVSWATSRRAGATGGARWIWAARDRHLAQPLAFLAARDVWLADPPARARLLALGDPEYVLYLNGKRVGAGGWRPGARLAAYEVGELLRPGSNRLLAELRSADGAGGFLACLVDDASGRVLAATDGAWRVFRRFHLGLLRGWLPVDPLVPAATSWTSWSPADLWPGRLAAGSSGAGASGGAEARAAATAGAGEGAGWAGAAGPGESALTWGRPPLGRWGRVVPAWPRPSFERLTGGRRPLPAASEGLYVPPPVTGVAGDDSMVLFDWGREVTGYLALERGYEPGMDPDLVQPPADRQGAALLWTGDAPPQPAGTGPEPSANVVMMSSAREWLDVRLRRFRYALVIGLPRPLAARVYAVDPAVAAASGMEIETAGAYPGAGSAAGGPAAASSGARAPLPPRPRGVFGLAPPRLRSPVEDEVRRKLKRLPGVAGRKEL
jgi:hypothetical protein